jgi:hypothetical protein
MICATLMRIEPRASHPAALFHGGIHAPLLQEQRITASPTDGPHSRFSWGQPATMMASRTVALWQGAHSSYHTWHACTFPKTDCPNTRRASSGLLGTKWRITVLYLSYLCAEFTGLRILY